MKRFVLLIAALAATPASAEVYQCRSDRGSLAMQVDMATRRMAMHDGRKRALLCGRGAQLAKCGQMADGGLTYDGRWGLIHFVPGTKTFGTSATLRVRAPGETAWTDYMCLKADAGVRRLFGGEIR